jgi:tRNA (guanine-N7-)-methyltransferase
MTGKDPENSRFDRFYGRRRGHRLRPGLQNLIDNLLPRLRIPVPGPDGSATVPSDRQGVAALWPDDVADIWMEIGFGGGEHLAAQAVANPKTGFIGCEPYVNGVAALLAAIEREEIDNIRIFDEDAHLLLGGLPDACLGRVFVLFGDPWPKKRHAKRRFLGPDTLDVLARLMKDGAELRFASDDRGYVVWTLEQVMRHADFAWSARTPADWRRPPEDWVGTRYETKARAAGRACFYLSFRRLRRGA